MKLNRHANSWMIDSILIIGRFQGSLICFISPESRCWAMYVETETRTGQMEKIKESNKER